MCAGLAKATYQAINETPLHFSAKGMLRMHTILVKPEHEGNFYPWTANGMSLNSTFSKCQCRGTSLRHGAWTNARTVAAHLMDGGYERFVRGCPCQAYQTSGLRSGGTWPAREGNADASLTNTRMHVLCAHKKSHLEWLNQVHSCTCYYGKASINNIEWLFARTGDEATRVSDVEARMPDLWQ